MNTEKIVKELKYSAVRSGGPGGQHANKTSSKVILQFDIDASQGLTEEEKSRLTVKLSGKLNKEGLLILSSEESRSQFKNKEIVNERLISLIKSSLKRNKKRIPTKISKSERARRLEVKKRRALKKSLRKKPGLD